MEHSGRSRKSPPSVLTLSESFDVPCSAIDSESSQYRCPPSFIRWIADPIPEVGVDWCVENLLTELERSDYANRFSNEDARLDWLLGRLCAKETVRELVFNVFDVLIPSRAIELRTAIDGSPHVFFAQEHAGRWLDSFEPTVEFDCPARSAENLSALANSIRISITHSAKRAYVLSIVSDGLHHPGIDCEKLQDVEAGMTEMVFEANERKFIEEQTTESKKSEAFLRLWTVREAVLKSLNSTAKKPFDLVEVHDDRFIISVASRSSDELVVSTIHDGYAVAICVL